MISRSIRHLPKMYFNSLREIQDLPEYSASYPTGVTIGKTWRRHDGAFDRAFLAAGGKAEWVICRYEEAPPSTRNTWNPKTGKYEPQPIEMAKVVSYRPVIRVKAPLEILA